MLAIDQATARLSLVDGALEVSPVRFGSAGGRAEMHAEIDAAAPTPAWRLRALADDAQLGEVWRELETQVPVEGELDLELDLRARGRSPRALAASLEGALGLAVDAAAYTRGCSASLPSTHWAGCSRGAPGAATPDLTA